MVYHVGRRPGRPEGEEGGAIQEAAQSLHAREHSLRALVRWLPFPRCYVHRGVYQGFPQEFLPSQVPPAEEQARDPDDLENCVRTL